MMRASTVALSAVALLLAGSIALQWRPAAPEPMPVRPPSQPGRAPATVSGAPGEGVRAAWVATALERPLFSQGRRPPAEATAQGAAPSGLPRLAGVMTGPFGRRAIFAGPEGGKPQVVQAGDAVGEFRVQSIEDGMVTLRGPDGVRQLRPSFATATGAAVSSSAPAPDLPTGLPPGILPEDIATPSQNSGKRP